MRRRVVRFAPEARDDIFAIYDAIADAGGAGTALAFVERLYYAGRDWARAGMP